MQPELIPEGYEVHHYLRHSEMLPFVQRQLRRLKNPAIGFYWFFNVLLFLILPLMVIYKPVEAGTGFLKISSGLAFFILLIPLHELLHGIAYRFTGAEKVSYHAIPRKMIFYALADRHVVGYDKFLFIAFTPFVVISAFLVTALVLAENDWSWCWWGALVMHTSGCAGDFALTGYFIENKANAPLTYDLKDEGVTVFLRKTHPEA